MPRLDARLQHTLADGRSARPIELCTSDRVHVPTAIGLVKPAVVIPEWVLRELSPEELNQIVLHEVAHLRRWDDWTNLAQKVVKALFFFHPAVWWIERQVSLEREMACDDAVVEATASPRAYAECLAHLAEKTLIRRSVALAQAALGRIRQTSLRVAQILDVNRSANRPLGSGRAWKPAVGLVGAFALVCVVGVSRAPRLVAFSDGAAGRAASSETSVTDSGISPVSTPISIVKARAVDKLSSGARRGQNFVRAAAARPNTSMGHASVVEASSVDASIVEASSVHASTTQASIMPASFRVTDASSRTPLVIPIAFTETIFVVVEGNDVSPDGAGIQIQMWRVMVLHPAVDPDGNRIPAKQT